MPVFKTIPLTNGWISIWQLQETAEELLCFFSPGELESQDFSKFTFEKRKTEWLATRALLKQLIGNSFTISYSDSGQPVLNHPVYQHISITHSREFVAVFIHQSKQIGIDIESQNRNYAPILKKYLSEAERCHIKDNTSIPCLYWCAKEALFKMVEEQGIDFKKQFEIISADPARQELLARYISSGQEKTYLLNFIHLNDHYMVWVMNDPIQIKSDSNLRFC
ncbi:MAG: 4'-phosphopantetheinyl transferase family protein [Candidatus Saccharibacteria bacterium]